MTPETPLIEHLPDGTLRHFHPVTLREIRNVLGRTFRPHRARKNEHPPQPLPKIPPPDDTCDFCGSRRLETPPEKKRWWRDASGAWGSTSFTPPSLIGEGPCEFRRISNLYEIVPLDHWVKNLGFQPDLQRQAWRDRYLADPVGQRHIESLVFLKLRKAGWETPRLAQLDQAAFRRLSEPFFFGSHDLIVSNRHYKPGARMDNDLLGSGDLDPDEHLHYLLAATETAQDILAHNPIARHVAIFQNWLSPSGASFEHLHKQVVGLDRMGPYPEALLRAVEGSPDFFARRFLAPAVTENWVIASNNHAIAVAAFGVSFPSIWVVSKSAQTRPWELSEEEFRGFSDLLHACHAATGSDIATNEEWNFAPPSCPLPLPLHVTLKWRVNVHAGFEGVTGIVISPLGPGEVKNRMIERLKTLQDEGRLGQVIIAPR